MKEELERKISNNKEAIFNLSGKVKENLGNTENNAKGGLTEKQIRDMIFSEINKYQKSIENHIVGNHTINHISLPSSSEEKITSETGSMNMISMSCRRSPCRLGLRGRRISLPGCVPEPTNGFLSA